MDKTESSLENTSFSSKSNTESDITLHDSTDVLDIYNYISDQNIGERVCINKWDEVGPDQNHPREGESENEREIGIVREIESVEEGRGPEINHGIDPRIERGDDIRTTEIVAEGYIDKPSVTAADLEGKTADEQEMLRMMGFCTFDTTKNKKVEGNDVGDVHVILKRKYRQYMNRKGGFNRPLDFVA
ncbi:hypothetical protein FQA39_LY00841 [Lamprigera yunnana]|nr:hypothetical protein FQA39_LY00841 [Lamprigera yunnana]